MSRHAAEQFGQPQLRAGASTGSALVALLSKRSKATG
jgi:hypothetical protein